MKIIDTNILYYKHKDSKYDIEIKSNFITSVNALEFLKNIEKKHSNSAKYYIPLFANSMHYGLIFNKFHKDKPLNKRFSDNITFDFKHDFESYIFYNNLSISQVINRTYKDLFQSSIQFLPKESYKDLKEKFSFIIDNKLICLQIDNRDIELAYNLLDQFLINHSIKEDFRNSWNDLLILAKSINSNAILITKDKLLNKFAAEIYNAKLIFRNENEVEIDFTKFDSQDSKYRKFESKGYINRGWQYKINK